MNSRSVFCCLDVNGATPLIKSFLSHLDSFSIQRFILSNLSKSYNVVTALTQSSDKPSRNLMSDQPKPKFKKVKLQQPTIYREIEEHTKHTTNLGLDKLDQDNLFMTNYTFHKW